MAIEPYRPKLLDRVAQAIAGRQRFNLGQYPQFLEDYYTQMGYAGSVYPLQLNTSVAGWQKTQEITATLPNYFTALRSSPPAFAAQMVRAMVMSQARLVWRNRRDLHTFTNPDLDLLQRPWTNGTQGELLGRMEWHVGLAGNSYVYRQSSQRLRVLRPDWVAIVWGSSTDPDDPKWQLDAEVVGYVYIPGGYQSGKINTMVPILPELISHWSPLPDPMSPGLGMSWITPALREIQGDKSLTEYKLAFFTNGATPNLVIKGVPAPSAAQFDEFVASMEKAHRGSVNAFKTLYLTAGADATVVGSNLSELALESVDAHSETRISYLSRVPAVILGIAAGLKGSSLNAGNYGEARRNFADTWYYAQLQDACAALGSITDAPGGCELWYDTRGVPLLREDSADAAKIEQTKQQTIVSYIAAGFTPESSVAAVASQDVLVLEHTGLVSVQLQPPGTAMLPGEPGAKSAQQLEEGSGPVNAQQEETEQEPKVAGAPPKGEAVTQRAVLVRLPKGKSARELVSARAAAELNGHVETEADGIDTLALQQRSAIRHWRPPEEATE